MNKRITIFTMKHPNFGIQGLMRYISIGNAVFWLISFINTSFLNYLTFSPYHILHGQIWRVVSFIFIPPSMGILGIVGIYFYYVIGNILEQYWGTSKFNLFILSGYLLTVIFGFIMYFVFGLNVSISATYVFLSMFFAYAAMFPDNQVLFMFIIPIKMKWLALIDLAFFIIEIISTGFPANLLPIIAILNVVVFCYDQLKYMFKR